MTKSLRKRHRQVWILLSLVLPPGLLLGWLVIPNQSPVHLLQIMSPELLPVAVSSLDKGGYRVTVRTNSTRTKWQLEWNNKEILSQPSAVIYKIPIADSKHFTPENAELIGRIESKGNYVFAFVNESPKFEALRFLVYDFIHQQVIDTVNLKL